MQTKKIVKIFISIITLIFIVFFVIAFKTNKEDNGLFYIKSKDTNLIINPYIDENDIFCLFIPSGNKLSDFIIESNKKIIFNNEVINGYSIDILSMNTTNILNVNNSSIEVIVYTIQDQGCMFINTTEKDINYVNENRGNKVDTLTYLFDSNGNELYSKLTGQIYGRGNSTWHYDKKPYNIKFYNKVNLIGTNESNKWVLLANYLDETNLKNKIVYDFASTLNIQWVPKSEFINLYIDGNYMGLYLLCESIEESEYKINLSKGDYLVERELTNRVNRSDNGIITSNGIGIQIKYPDKLSKGRKQTFINEFQKYENQIFDLTSSLENLIDYRTWAYCYLIDEIFLNKDAGAASSYMYIKDNILYRGPIWDYDQILNNNYVNQVTLSKYHDDAIGQELYEYYLLNRDDFYSEVISMYDNEFLPKLNKFINSNIKKIEESISNDSELDQKRWKYINTISSNDIINCLNNRIEFLNDYIVNRNKYSIVHYIDSDSNYAVKKGTKISDIEIFDFNSQEYYDYDSNNLIDKNLVVNDDINISSSQRIETKSEEEHTSFGILNIAFSCLFILIFLFAAKRTYEKY